MGAKPVLKNSMYNGGDLDFDEPISCAQWDKPSSYSDSKTFRWYRLMASSAALLLENRMIEDNEHYFLANILLDTFALNCDQEAPFDLVSAICRETRINAFSWSKEVKLFCVLGELLMAGSDGRSSEEIEVLCEIFEALEKEISLDSGYVSEEYCWGTTHFNQLHPTWLSLAEAHFPTEKRAIFLRTKLLKEGARWKTE